jgi:hypothetical protein
MNIEHIPYIVVFVVTAVILFILYIFRSYILFFKNKFAVDKYKTLLTIISTIASVIFGSAVVLQVINFTSQKKQQEIDSYTNLSKEFLDEILLHFHANPDMDYYYKELFQIQKMDENTKRNLHKEHIISMLIFSKCAKFAIFEFESTNEAAKMKVHLWLGHVFNTLMKSDILRNYWIYEYKPKLSGPATQKYMEKYFDL